MTPMLLRLLCLAAGATTMLGAVAAPLLPDKAFDAIEPQVISWRRHLHENPELSFEEVKTAAYVAQALRAMPGIEVFTGIGKTGVKAVLRGGKPGPVIALRADMDALPVEERNDLPFRSKVRVQWQGKETGVMHACGHDAHVAMLLGAATLMSGMRAELPGTIVFLFQPAEEGGGGAYAMVADGALDNPKVEAVFGQHIGAGAPGGGIGYRRGGTMASGDQFRIVVKGAGGHGAMPWTARDPIVTAAQIITLMQSIVSRQANLSNGAAVITVGQMHGGNRENIIPEEATLSGTIRTLNEATRKQTHDALTRMAQNVAAASGLTAEVSISRGYPVLNNDPALTSQVVQSLEQTVGKAMVAEVPPVMASEDFGAFSSRVPGVYWFLNASPFADRAGPSNHSPLFAINEQYMKAGVKALVNVSTDYLMSRTAR